jgi:hypothetical protein
VPSGCARLHRKIERPITTSTDPPAEGKETGDGCAAVVRGLDGYDYAYWLRNGGHSWSGGYSLVARAPSSDPRPGNGNVVLSLVWTAKRARSTAWVWLGGPQPIKYSA